MNILKRKKETNCFNHTYEVLTIGEKGNCVTKATCVKCGIEKEISRKKATCKDGEIIFVHNDPLERYREI